MSKNYLNMDKFYLYSKLVAYGNVHELDIKIESPDKFVKWTEDNFNYVQYNPRKFNNRQGLSITSLDGGMSGIPDLDSLPEYNTTHNTSYTELDFNVATPVLEHEELKEAVSPIRQHMFRSHILKLGPGGFFPPHRDLVHNFDSFRVIVPLQNVNPPRVNFVVDGKIYHWQPGHFYFVDTAKLHYLFNAGFEPSYWIVFNVSTNQESYNSLINYVKY